MGSSKQLMNKINILLRRGQGLLFWVWQAYYIASISEKIKILNRAVSHFGGRMKWDLCLLERGQQTGTNWGWWGRKEDVLCSSIIHGLDKVILLVNMFLSKTDPSFRPIDVVSGGGGNDVARGFSAGVVIVMSWCHACCFQVFLSQRGAGSSTSLVNQPCDPGCPSLDHLNSLVSGWSSPTSSFWGWMRLVRLE